MNPVTSQPATPMSSPSISPSATHERTAATRPLPSGISPASAAYRRIALALFLAGFSTFSLLYCVQPLLPAFAREFHIGAAASSLSLSVSTGFLAVSILCAGALSERVGRRGLMFTSMTSAALFNLLVASASKGSASRWAFTSAARLSAA